MKAVLSLLLIMASSPANAEDDDYQAGFNEGEQAALTLPRAPYLLMGIGSGLSVGLIGTASAALTAGKFIPADLPDELKPENAHTDEFKSGYYDGFERKLHRRRTGAAALGGVLGTATFFILYMSAL